MRSRGGGGRLLVCSLGLPHIKSKALNSWEVMWGTYFFTKDVFENYKVVFTVGTSVASVATAWGGYTLHHHHQTKIVRRLESIEKAMQTNTEHEHSELRKLVDRGSSRASTLFATAATTFILGKKMVAKFPVPHYTTLGWHERYGFGRRGGRWYANRKFRKEQMKMLGQTNPNRWQLLGSIKTRGLQFQSLKMKLARCRALKISGKTSEQMPEDVAATAMVRTKA